MSSYASESSPPPPSEVQDTLFLDSDSSADGGSDASDEPDLDQDTSSEFGSDLTPIHTDDEERSVVEVPHHTPIKSAKSHHPKDDAYNKEVVKEMEGRWVEVTTEQFLEDFLPGENPAENFDPDVLASWEQVFSVLKFPKGAETGTYPHLCKAFNTVLADVEKITDPLRFYQTNNFPQSGYDDLKPDLSLYSTLEKTYIRSKAGAKKDEARVQWSRIEIAVEVKVNPKYAPFNFSDKPLKMKNTTDGLKSLAQMIKYVSEIQLHQHRTCVFFIWIQSDRMRLTRWDRTGAVVSKAFQYTQNPDALFTFLYRYAIADRGQRGHDTTVALVAKEDGDRATLEAFQSDNRWEMWYLQNDLLADNDLYPLRKIVCPLSTEEKGTGDDTVDEDTTREGVYLIRKHRSGTHTPVGRGTKCYVAFDVTSTQLVFIKDYWCADAPAIASEGTVYARLHQRKVRNIATVIAGGDVNGLKAQYTKTQAYMTDSEDSENPKPRYHHRLVFEELGRPLETHKGQAQLIRVVKDAVIAHSDAYKKALIIHRDVCPENILINLRTNKGMLCDWEFSMPTDYASAPASQPNRSGSWVTMSARLLGDPAARGNHRDDLESFIHSIGIMRLRFYPHSFSLGYRVVDGIPQIDPGVGNNNTALATYVHTFYTARCHVSLEDPVTGTGWKSYLMTSKDGPAMIGMLTCPLRSLLEELYQLFSVYYTHPVDTPMTISKRDDHAAVLTIFRKYSTQARLTSTFAKTHDQLEGMCSPTGDQPKQMTGSRRAARTLPQLSESEEDEDDDGDEDSEADDDNDNDNDNDDNDNEDED